MPIAENFQSVFSKDWEINFTQCTPNGCLKYTDLCNILQLTAGDHAQAGGISFTDMQEFHQAWVLSRIRVEITELPKWRDIVTVKTWIVSLENSRSVRALEMYVNGRKMAGSETFWAVFNTKTRRPEALALPHAHFIKYPKQNATAARVKKIDFSPEMKPKSSRKVVLSDLDIVDHVNNVKYLEWCLDCVNARELLEKGIAAFDMNFMKELTLGHDVAILEAAGENGSVFSVEKDGKACFGLDLKWNASF